MIDKLKKNAKKNVIICSIGIVIAALALFLHFTGSLNWIEYKSYDSRIKQTAKYLTRDDNVVVIILNQESLDWAKEELGWSYPWPRESYGKMVKFFNRGNAASMAFDMVYTEPSIYGDDDDRKFAEADEEFGKTIQAVFYASNESTKGVLPIDSIKNTAAKIATVQSLLDEDGVARRARFYSSAKDEAQRLNEPSLAVASLQLSDEMPDIDTIPKAKSGKKGESEQGMYVRFYVSNDENADPNSLDAYLPYSAKTILLSEFLMEYEESKSEGAETDISLFKPLADKMDSDEGYLKKYFEQDGKSIEENIITKEDVEGGMFEDTHVFFALFAPGLFDICATPIGTNYPGVGVHIAMVNTILQEDYLRDIPDYATALIVIIAVVLGILIASAFPQKSKILPIKIAIFVILACT
ncbi:MAG: CHASE2 domain-containing protein, partial [Treponema sp.]|nr:CHASE2 domain-containing protein [Treponema sp.]